MFFWWGGPESDTQASLQKMIEGCSLLINTIPELVELHTKLLTWLFLPLLHLAQSFKSSCHNYSSSGAELGQAPFAATQLHCLCIVAWPLPSPV